MFKNTLTITSLFLALVLFLGCSSDDENVNLDTEKSKDIILTNPLTGVLLDSPISGVNYTCSKISGITNTAGEFTCNTGDDVTFSLGGHTLATIKVQEIITPSILFANDPISALNFAQLIQTIDNDNNLSNGISPDIELLGLLSNESLDFTSENFDSEIQAVLGERAALVSEEDAQEHLDETLSGLGINADGSVAMVETPDDNTADPVENNETVPIVIVDVTAPAITSSATFTVDENQNIVGTVTTDDENALLTLSGIDRAFFTLISSALSFTNPANFETKEHYSITLIATDAVGNVATQEITINLNNLDEIAPDFTSADHFSILENTQEVAEITTDDNTSMFNLMGGDSDKFNLSTEGILSFKIAPDFEQVQTYTLSVVASDMFGNESTQEISIAVTNALEVAKIEQFSITISESYEPGDIIGEIAILALGDGLIDHFTLSGVNSEHFTINASGVISVSPDTTLNYATYSNYALMADATNSAGDSESVAVLINLRQNLHYFQVQKIVASTVTDRDSFAAKVDGDGQYLVVAARGTYKGYIYKRDSNAELSMLHTLSVPLISDVAMSGKNILISKTNAINLYQLDEEDNLSGSLMMYTYIDAGAGSNDGFGASIKIKDNFIAVGAPNENSGQGSLYLFTLSAENILTKIGKVVDLDGLSGQHFSNNVSIDWPYVVVGSERATTDGVASAGKTFVYKVAEDNTSIALLDTLVSDVMVDYSYYGASVDIENSVFVVGEKVGGKVHFYKIEDNESISPFNIINKDETLSGSFAGEISFDGEFLAIGLNDTGLYHEINAHQGYYDGSILIYHLEDNNSVSLINEVGTFDDKGTSIVNSYGYGYLYIDGQYLYVGVPFATTDDLNSAGALYAFKSRPEEKIYIYTAPNIDTTIYEGEEFINTFEIDSPASSLSFSIEGTDRDVFNVSSNTITASSTFDYESPLDSGNDNQYDFSLYVHDSRGSSSDLNLSLSVSDAKYLYEQSYSVKSSSMAVDGNYLITAGRQGSFVYKKDDNGVLNKLASLGRSIDTIDEVAISGDYIALGDSRIDSYKGAVYLYKRFSDEDIRLIATLQADDAETSDYLGRSVCIDGDYIVVGATFENEGGAGAGAAYVFKRHSDTNVTQIAKLLPGDIEAGDKFGTSVSIDNGYIAIGSGYKGAGASYLFKVEDNETITELDAFTVSDAKNFGSNIVIRYPYILIAASAYTSTTELGDAFIFEIDSNSNTVVERARTSLTEGIIGNNFGFGMDMRGDRVVMGSYGNNYIYIYDFNHVDYSFELIERKKSTSGELNQQYGVATAIMGEEIFVAEDAQSEVHKLILDPNQP